MIEHLINELKMKVAALTYDEDGDPIAFDKRMAEIDLLIYNIRSKAFVKKPLRPRQDMSKWDKRDMDSWLDELSLEMSK